MHSTLEGVLQLRHSLTAETRSPFSPRLKASFDVNKLAWMCFSRYLTLLESLILFSLAKFENLTSHGIALGKITQQNANIVHRDGSQNSPQGTFKSAF